MIISTKSLQRCILCTERIANNNDIKYQELLQEEYNILVKFDFKIGQHNYVRIANYYMEKWDKYQK